MRVTLLGFTVPPQMLDWINTHDALMASQTHRFAWSLVRALARNGVEVDLISAAPVSDFPRNPRVFWGRGCFVVDGTQGLLLPFVNLTGFKHVTRFLASLWWAARRLRRRPPDWLLVHGVHSPFLWFAVLASRGLRLNVAVVLTDPPGVIRTEDGRLRTFLKRIDIGIVRAALARTDAVVVLAEALAEDFAPGVPYLVVEGLLDVPRVESRIEDPSAKTVVFAGSLRAEYGVANLVEAFRAIRAEDVRLEIYGRGPLEPWLVDQAEVDPRIATPRLVPPEALPEIYAGATVLVQPRQVDQDFVRYSFPSKLIEYMASGTPTVSTRLPTIPPEYETHVVWSEGDTPASLARAIVEVSSWSQERRRTFGEGAARFIRDSRSTRTQGNRIKSFLADLQDGVPG